MLGEREGNKLYPLFRRLSNATVSSYKDLIFQTKLYLGKQYMPCQGKIPIDILTVCYDGYVCILLIDIIFY